jgi:putative membrane protein
MKDTPTRTLIMAEEQLLLASERTFSAWIRTALAAMAGGLAVLRLISFKSDIHRFIAHTIGQLLIIWGCAIIVAASHDYQKNRSKLIHATSFKSSQFGYLLIVLPLLLISFLLLGVTFPY